MRWPLRWGLCAVAVALMGAGSEQTMVQVDLRAALAQLPESKAVRKKIRARRAGLQAQVDRKRRRLADPELSEADREFERQTLNSAIDRMERDLAAEQDRLLAPLIARLQERVAKLRRTDLMVVDATGREVFGLSGPCNLTDWLASDPSEGDEEHEAPHPRGCERVGIVGVRPALAFATTERAKAMTQSLDAKKAELEADLRARAEQGEDVQERAQAAQRQLRAAERRAQDEADAATRRAMRGWSQTHPDWVIVQLEPQARLPDGACDATAALARTLESPGESPPPPSTWCQGPELEAGSPK